jgi:hypothetical protein
VGDDWTGGRALGFMNNTVNNQIPAAMDAVTMPVSKRSVTVLGVMIWTACGQWGFGWGCGGRVFLPRGAHIHFLAKPAPSDPPDTRHNDTLLAPVVREKTPQCLCFVVLSFVVRAADPWGLIPMGLRRRD